MKHTSQPTPAEFMREMATLSRLNQAAADPDRQAEWAHTALCYQTAADVLEGRLQVATTPRVLRVYLAVLIALAVGIGIGLALGWWLQ